nr:hypothetical protein [Paenimyroides aestuarii]
MQYETKIGYIDITKAPISTKEGEYASHNFTFLQSIIVVGGIFRL